MPSGFFVLLVSCIAVIGSIVVVFAFGSSDHESYDDVDDDAGS